MKRAAFCGFLLFTLLLINTARARSIWLPPPEGHELRLEFLHPEFDAGSPVSTLGGLWTLTVDQEVMPGRYLSIEVPRMRFRFENSDESVAMFGNPYLGFHGSDAQGRWRGEFGMRFPSATLENDDSYFTVRNGAAYLARQSDRVDNFEAWYPDIMTLRAEASFTHLRPRELGFKIGFGPLVWVDTDDVLRDDAEVWIHFHAQVLLPTGEWVTGAGISARSFVSAHGPMAFSERTLQEISFFANRNVGTWRPAVRIRMPWDSALDYAGPSMIVSLGYTY